jgi:hypothetical protein
MNDQNSPDSTEQAREETATIERLFALAVQRAGGQGALVQHLRITYSELKTYLKGEAMPPEEVLLRAVELVIKDSKAVTSGLSGQALRSLVVSEVSGL